MSSAETFAWAVTETKRVVSVGRPTGGWGIVPKGYKCPSGLIDFRLGVNDRPTPITGVHTQGTGWPPDVLLPYGPVFCARPDPVCEVGLEILRILHAGIPRERVAQAFRQIAQGNVRKYHRGAKEFAKKVTGWKHGVLEELFSSDLEATLALENALLRGSKFSLPDAAGVARRLSDLRVRAENAELKKPLRQLEKTLKKIKAERAAQEAVLELLRSDKIGHRAQQAFLKRYGKTRTGGFVRSRL